MNQRYADNIDGQRFNEELREYEGFSAILSEVEQTAASDRVAELHPPQSGLDLLRPALMPNTDEERAAHDAAIKAMMADPDSAELVQRLQTVVDARRASAVRDLLPSSQTENASEE